MKPEFSRFWVVVFNVSLVLVFLATPRPAFVRSYALMQQVVSAHGCWAPLSHLGKDGRLYILMLSH